IILAFPLLYFKAQPYSPLKSYILTAFIIGFDLNVVLAIFNLIPLPPLDGFKILSGFMPSRWYYKMLEYEVYITMAFAILMFTGVLGRILRPIVKRKRMGFISPLR
ncbi:MAG: site-2 protease family protein, partial [Flavobacteriales bacterium]